ncbi:MAG: 4-coumarate--CoA ligase, partial [Sphingomonas sp.]|nr:4-coumarate--CoA ligase [Sphingomonas sp.]
MSAADALASNFSTLPDLIRLHAVERGSKPAVIGEDGAFSYAELDRMMDRIAAALQRDGLAQGQAVAIIGAPSIAYAALFLGTLRAGGAATPLAPGSTPEQLAAMIADCGAAQVFVDAAADDALSGQAIAARIIRIGSDDHATWLAPEGSRPAPVATAPDDPFNIIYSSGTTGTPKGIVQSHAMRWAHIHRNAGAGFGDAVTMVATPLYSNTTLVVFLPTLGWGGTAVIMAKFDARRFLEMAQAHRATHAMLVPVQYSRIMAIPDFDAFDLSSFRLKTCTSAPFSATLKADVCARWPG